MLISTLYNKRILKRWDRLISRDNISLSNYECPYVSDIEWMVTKFHEVPDEILFLSPNFIQMRYKKQCKGKNKQLLKELCLDWSSKLHNALNLLPKQVSQSYFFPMSMIITIKDSRHDIIIANVKQVNIYLYTSCFLNFLGARSERVATLY